MSKIDELIELLCPNGVEFKKLGDVAEYRRGSFPQPYGNRSWYDGEGSMPFVQVADVADNMLLVKDTKQKISKLAQPKSVFVPKGSVIVTLQGSIGRVAVTQYDSFVDRTVAIFISYKFEINKKYFAYQLERKFSIEKEFARGGIIKTITKEEFTKFTIPVPPLPIQQEIVAILDKFTQLKAELNAELEGRNKQYEYYREQLLRINSEELSENGTHVEWESKELQEVANYSKTRIAAIELNSETYVGVDNLLQNKQGKTFSSYVPSNGNLTRFEIGDILIGNIRPYLKKIWWARYSGGASGDVLAIRINDKSKSILSPKFLYHILSSDKFFEFNVQFSKGGKMPRGDKSSIMKYKIPLPPLPKQEHIAEKLDNFDKLVNDTTVGLPGEIAARIKQFEYYRSRLLDFKNISNG